MAATLDPEVKRLRGLKPAQLADEVGMLKAQIAAIEEELDRVKAEGVRRNLTEFDSELFHCTLTPPGTSRRLDKDTLLAVFGQPFVDHFCKDVVGRDWSLRCTARPAKTRSAANAA